MFFALGGLARHLLHRSAMTPIAGSVTLVLWVGLGLAAPHLAAFASWVAVPYVVLALGNARIPVLTSAARWGDVSYGLYLWGFLIQQLVIERFGNLAPAIDIPITLACALVVAWLSWQNIEAPALRPEARRSGPQRAPAHRRGPTCCLLMPTSVGPFLGADSSTCACVPAQRPPRSGAEPICSSL